MLKSLLKRYLWSFQALLLSQSPLLPDSLPTFTTYGKICPTYKQIMTRGPTIIALHRFGNIPYRVRHSLKCILSWRHVLQIKVKHITFNFILLIHNVTGAFLLSGKHVIGYISTPEPNIAGCDSSKTLNGLLNLVWVVMFCLGVFK